MCYLLAGGSVKVPRCWFLWGNVLAPQTGAIGESRYGGHVVVCPASDLSDTCLVTECGSSWRATVFVLGSLNSENS